MREAHTPLPWRRPKYGAEVPVIMGRVRPVAYCGGTIQPTTPYPDIEECRANTTFIIRSCNNVEALAEALDELIQKTDYLSAIEGSRVADVGLGRVLIKAREARDAYNEEGQA